MPGAIDYMYQYQNMDDKHNLDQQEDLAQALANQKAQQLSQFNVPMAQANLKLAQARPGYMNAQTGYLNAQTQEYPNLMEAKLAQALKPSVQDYQLVNTPNGMVRVNKTTGQMAPVLDNTGKPVYQLQKNGFSLTQGGMTPSGQQSPGTMQVDGQGNIVASPASPHSRYSTGGATLTDTATGKSVSVPTKEETAKLQNQVIGSKVAIPELVNTYKQIAPMLGSSGITGRFDRGASEVGRLFGIPTPEYDNFQASMQSGIPTMADSLLKTLGLYGAGVNRIALENALKPDIGQDGIPNDTSDSYARRISSVIAGLIMRHNKYNEVLQGGLPLNSNYSLGDIKQAIENKVYNSLTGQNESSPTGLGINSSELASALAAEKKRRGLK